jgi:hypothetical protein
MKSGKHSASEVVSGADRTVDNEPHEWGVCVSLPKGNHHLKSVSGQTFNDVHELSDLLPIVVNDAEVLGGTMWVGELLGPREDMSAFPRHHSLLDFSAQWPLVTSRPPAEKRNQVRRSASSIQTSISWRWRCRRCSSQTL